MVRENSFSRVPESHAPSDQLYRSIERVWMKSKPIVFHARPDGEAGVEARRLNNLAMMMSLMGDRSQ